MEKGYFKVLVNPDMDFDIFYVPLRKNIPQEQRDFCIMVEETEDILKAMWMQKMQRKKKDEERTKTKISKKIKKNKNFSGSKQKDMQDENTEDTPEKEENEDLPEEIANEPVRIRYEDMIKNRAALSVKEILGNLNKAEYPFISSKDTVVLTGIPNEIEIKQELPSENFRSKLVSIYNKNDFFANLK